MVSNILLIDADMLSYELSYIPGLEYEDIPDVARTSIKYLLDKFNTDRFILALSCDRSKGFRRGLAPFYKAKRDDQPINYVAMGFKEVFKNRYGALLQAKLEADDILSILATGRHKEDGIIISKDKDFKSTPCKLVNRFDLDNIDPYDILQEISEQEAFMNHMKQTVIGDSVDGVRGAVFRGKAAAKILDNKTAKVDIWAAVVGLYTGERRGLTQTENDAILNAQLTYLLRAEDFNIKTKEIKLWNPKEKIYNRK